VLKFILKTLEDKNYSSKRKEMERLIKDANRWIHKELSENYRLNRTGIIDFQFDNKKYRFRMYVINGSEENRYATWYIELWDMLTEEGVKLDRLSCNAGYKVGLVLMAELLVRRHLGGSVC
jgi:valyl-tRNA synthetase